MRARSTRERMKEPKVATASMLGLETRDRVRVLRRRHGTSETWLRSSEAELGQCDENNLEHDKDTNGFFERIE